MTNLRAVLEGLSNCHDLLHDVQSGGGSPRVAISGRTSDRDITTVPGRRGDVVAREHAGALRLGGLYLANSQVHFSLDGSGVLAVEGPCYLAALGASPSRLRQPKMGRHDVTNVCGVTLGRTYGSRVSSSSPGAIFSGFLRSLLRPLAPNLCCFWCVPSRSGGSHVRMLTGLGAKMSALRWRRKRCVKRRPVS